MSQIIDIKTKNESAKETKGKQSNYANVLIVSDLDNFFQNIYEYYYNRGYLNILTQAILDNISYLFAIHFLILNIFIIDWNSIIYKCKNETSCDLEILDYFSFKFLENRMISFSILYSILALYYILFLWKSISFVVKMKGIKSLFDKKLRIKQKEMENIKFNEIVEKLIELQKTENFCRVKENLSKFDIISRIMRKENYMIGMITNDIINFKIKFPVIGEKDFSSNYLFNMVNECIMNFAFLKGEVNVNKNFYNLRYFQTKLFAFMLLEIIFVPSIILYKIIFWTFKNADNVKSIRNLTQKIWTNSILIKFKNYNELQHHFEYRINTSYKLVGKFMNCFKERMMGIISKFFIIISGSFLVLIFIISSIDDRLLTSLKFMGKNFVWIAFSTGLILSIFRDDHSQKKNSDEEDYIENVDLKERLYKSIVNKVVNIQLDWRNVQNFSSIFKKINAHYETAISCMVQEILSIIFFPFIWLRIIFDSRKLIKFFKFYSKHLEGIGTIYSYSNMDIKNFKCLREKDSNISEYSFNDRKFINSFIAYNYNFHKNLNNDDFEMISDCQIDTEINNQFKIIEKKLFDLFNKESKFNEKNDFKEFIFYHITTLNINDILTNKINSMNDSL